MEDVQLYTTIIIVLGCIAAAMVKVGRAEKAQRSPPGPRGVPIVGHLHLIGPSPHKSLHELALIHGPILRLSLGSVPCVVVSSAEAAKEFLGTQETLFSNRPHLSVVNYLSYPSSDFTFAEHGPYWRLMKKLCMTRLLGSSTLDRLYPIRRAEIRKLLSSVILLRREGTREAIEVRRELTKLTSSVISRMIMSRGLAETDNEDEEIRTIVAESTEVLGEFNFSDYIWFCKGVDFQGLWKKSKRIHDRFDRLIERVIREREEDRKKKNGESGDEFSDLLDILLDVSEEEKEDRSSENIALTKEHIKAFVLDVLVAGTDTSSITIEWALAELINHPNTMQKAREELDSIVGQTRLVEESDIPNLPYIQAVVKETLRLHPPGPILLREAAGKSTVNVGGYEIAEKTRVLVNVWSIHRDPRHWENPLEFRPERFLDGRTVDVKGQSFDFLAFGSGRRGCPGTSLGLGIVQTALAALVQCFDWSVHGVLSMEEGRGFTLPMARPLVCSPTPRFSPIPL